MTQLTTWVCAEKVSVANSDSIVYVQVTFDATTTQMTQHTMCYTHEAFPATNTNKYLQEHTHTRLTALCLGLPGWAGTRKVKPIWILLKQETVRGSGISWTICKSAPCIQTDNHTSTPPLSFLQAGCPSCHPTNSIKALKALPRNVPQKC